LAVYEGDESRILAGPFAGRTGVVVSVEDEVATVIVDVFSRATPVQLGLHELEPIRGPEA
jgi:transcription antitermination factor NusG